MIIKVGDNSGFCQGVLYTVSKANEVLNNDINKKVYCLRRNSSQ